MGVDINILQLDPKTKPQGTGLAVWTLTSNPQKVDGMRMLMQIVGLTLLRLKGADAFAIDYGANLRLLMEGGALGMRKEEVELRANMITRDAEKQILAEQEGKLDIPADERLKYLTFLGLIKDPDDSSKYSILMEMANQAGRTESIDLPIDR